MILACNNIDKTYVDNHVLRGVSFHINEHDRVALIGPNGCGKSTLIKIIMGLENADDGIITTAKDIRIGYLPQNALLNSHETIENEVLSVKKDLSDLEAELERMHEEMGKLEGSELDETIARYNEAMRVFELEGGYVYKSEVRGILMGLGFEPEEFCKTVDKLSGGQKTRVALAKLLLNSPDLIILDEPTNHLDMSSIAWLENYLGNYRNTVFVVSHDRYFLDRIVNKVVEIDCGKATTFEGNYSDYSVKKEILRTAAVNAYIKQQAEIEHQEAVIEKLRSFNREKSIKRAESRVKMLEKMDRLERPSEYDGEMQLVLSPGVESGKDVLSIRGLKKSYGTRSLFENVNIEIKKGEHVAIIGDNGTGKSTLLKILNGVETADEGEVRFGTKVALGYYDQEQHVLNLEKTIFDEISDAYPSLNNTQIRNTLAAFLFTGEDVLKRIDSLSGGEKGRVALAKLMLSEANLIVLDEPTNHLDISSKEILEQALNAYDGTLLYVSHDRYFINRTADRILELSGNSFNEYLGDYDYYLEKKAERSATDQQKSNNTKLENEGNKNDWLQQKQQQAGLRKIKNRLSDNEKTIEELEAKKQKLDEALYDPVNATNSAKLNEISADLKLIDDKLAGLYDEWEMISSELEAFAEQHD
ncbi:MAG: ABC-F family ATP-binding cassette domain-containing protein [Lachnospiraceae bacterium]|nr:ABC-F family ATP-binding cassette domain-containing protein [Lachnospiraceae bacterium]